MASARLCRLPGLCAAGTGGRRGGAAGAVAASLLSRAQGLWGSCVARWEHGDEGRLKGEEGLWRLPKLVERTEEVEPKERRRKGSRGTQRIRRRKILPKKSSKERHKMGGRGAVWNVPGATGLRHSLQRGQESWQ